MHVSGRSLLARYLPRIQLVVSQHACAAERPCCFALPILSSPHSLATPQVLKTSPTFADHRVYSGIAAGSKDMTKKHDYDYDLVTIGAGSGGVRASRFAAQYYGAKVAIIELPFGWIASDEVGGECYVLQPLQVSHSTLFACFGSKNQSIAAYPACSLCPCLRHVFLGKLATLQRSYLVALPPPQATTCQPFHTKEPQHASRNTIPVVT